ncbi:alanyl-tRNA synthetase [Povalibacter uvarum]|uniref:Alanine--tRNA ligase n=1 Tax=Povalibacter uvarum TaxID=732238 RepID=A0A841HP76_9GAMM|nr:alanine--tRNA ligase [Povalibacter uvarum]MBB6094947.1 alanyl-tRNA synthetase [Povalibacter uvarum]
MTTPKRLSSAALRALFLEFFRENGHQVVASSSLVPGNDPTLLFTNAGMVQFKDVFLGKDKRSYNRAASSQRCVRAGGKHNDLENVGYTARHHTFFEMLGNFSFGDYFKKDAIRLAWDLVTGSRWLGIDPQKLMVTVYHTDDEAFDIWHKQVGLPADRIVRIGDKPGGGSDNFWQMGETGPCGPCTEIFYDHGAHIPGGPPGSPDADGDRWIEIWNLVFMQFDRSADGVLTPLPKPSVDTGMGLERTAAVMQGVHSNYEIDLFVNLIKAAAKVTNTADLSSNSLKVIADHIRACSFLIGDGVLPSNEGRGYVLRRIIRRAIRHGYQLGQTQPFFYSLVAALEAEMGEAFPELKAQRAHIERVLRQEEERFAETLTQGMSLLEGAIGDLKGKVIPGETVFRLYDTYGFPVDLTADIARERGLSIDEPGFESAMEAQRERARAASKFGVDLRSNVSIEGKTSFSGYEGLQDSATIVALLRGSEQVQALRAGEEGRVILDRTPFYAESGGQVGDQGVLSSSGGRFEVIDTLKLNASHAHLGKVASGELKVGDRVQATVDAARRRATMQNHTATHLLHAALRKVLGTHVTQKGSLVAPDRLRFDFSHYAAVTPAELKEIERLVNDEIRANAAAEISLMQYDAAVASGAMALFGEKYEDEVRVLRIGEFSTELCGGTHVSRAGDIGLFKITSEGGVAAGIRRIEAVTGQGALDWVTQTDQVLRDLAALVKGSREDVEDKVRQLIDRSRKLEKEVSGLKQKLASGQSQDLSAGAVDVAGLKVVATRVDGADAATLRTALDQLKDKLKTAAIVLASVQEGDKVAVIAGVTSDSTSRIKAGDLVNVVAQKIGGRGGGRPDMAQAGGNDPSKLDEALEGVVPWVQSQLRA